MCNLSPFYCKPLPALNSKLPSSLDQGAAALVAVLQRRKKQRLQVGRGNIVIGAPATGKLHDLQKQHSLPNSSSEEPPPLKGTVEPAPGAAKFATKRSLFADNNKELTMTAPKFMSLREMEKLGQLTTDRKTVWVSKSNWTKLLDQIKAIKATNNELYSANRILAKSNKDLVDKNKALTDENTKLVEDYEGLEQTSKEVSTTTRQNRGGTKARNPRKDEIKDDVKKQIAWFVKAVLFRTHKFVQPGDGLQKATKLVWAGIKDTLELDKGPNAMDEASFVEIYDSCVLSELSNRRQYHQGRCWKNAAWGTKFGYCVVFCVIFTINGPNSLVVPPFTQTGSRNIMAICPPLSKLRTSGIFRSAPNRKIQTARQNWRRKPAKTAQNTRNIYSQLIFSPGGWMCFCPWRLVWSFGDQISNLFT